MKKLIFLLTILLFFSPLDSKAQQKDFEWRLGVSGGYSNYYGDLSPHRIRGISNWDAIHHLLYFNENYFERPSFKISLERQLSTTIGLMFSYGEYHFAMSDRYIQRDGTLMLDNPNFDRGLNFSNHTRDMGLSFVFKADNDRLLPAKSWIAPYFVLGFGLINFEVSGDLLDTEGNRYNYNSTNIIHNRIYETDLHAVRTELANGYQLGAFYTNLGLGFRIRMASGIELFAQSDFMYTFTDYLDDVSGKYRATYDNDFQAYAAKPGTNIVDPQRPFRGDPDGRNDWIIYHGVGIKFNLGASKKTFSAPRLSTYYPEYGKRQVAPPIELPKTATDSIPLEKQGNTFNYTYNIQLAETERLDSLRYATRILAWDQEIQQRETKIVNGQVRQKSLLELRRNFDQQFEVLSADEKLDPKEKENLLKASEKRRFDLRYSIDSIGRREREMRMEIDSISRLKRDFRMEQRILMIPGIDSLPGQKEGFLPERVIRGETVTRGRMDQTSERDAKIQKQESELAERSALRQPTTGPTQFQESQSPLSPTSQRLGQEPQRFGQEPERMRSLEEDNRYLRSERDRLLIEKTQQPQTQNNRTIRRTTATNKQTTVREERPRDESDRRRRWWWPFAAAGGIAATAAILSDNDREEETEIQDTTALSEATAIETIPLDQKELENISLAIASTLMGIPFTQEMIAQKDTAAVKELLPVIAESIAPAQILRDTIFVDTDPVVRILKSKEAIYFKVNQRIPDVEEINKLIDLASFIQENDGYGLVLTGYADNTGNVNYNLRLADERMKNVGSIIMNKFEIPQEKIRYESGGQVVRGTSRVSNDLDRKVEVRVERGG
jgi:outer membrane protein OmpA-like peptidoglycan-associated protein